MPLQPSSRLGSYEILTQIGVGGMGEVYRARDTRLKRDVALKVLPDTFAQDADRLARFQREAELLATLNHPNIAGIYGLEESNGVRALVLELVEGPTLADRIAKGPIPPDEALPIAKQIAEALEAAHERGVIHRDLKPANVKVRPDGTVKVLDFGLAKALDSASVNPPVLSQSPTLTTPAFTVPGVILGTAAYMSPEQAGAAHVDQRCDIWAFGCVLYEMLTGKPAFSGDSVARVLAKVLERQPDFAALPAATPPSVARVLRRCLEKDPKKRVHHIADVRIELEDDAAGEVPAEGKSARTLWQQPLPWAVVVGLVLGALGTAAIWSVSRPRSSETPSVVRSVVVTLSGADAEPNGFRGQAIAPDGKRVVYAAGGVLRLRSLDDLDSQPLRDSEGGTQPAFSPDGQSLAFFAPAQSVIKRLPIRGGPATIVARTDGGDPRGLSWAVDDTIVFATATSRGLWRVRVAGGDPEPLTKVASGEAIGHTWPSALPNGRGVLFEAFRGASSRVGVVSLEGRREVTYPVAVGRSPRYARTGHIVFVDAGGLRAVGFDPSRLVVTNDDRVSLGEAVRSSTSGADFDFAANGSLVYIPVTSETRALAWVSRDGREAPFGLPPRNYGTLRVSPDGSRIAADIRDGGRPPGIWVTNVDRPGWTRIASSQQDAGDWFPKWTPDGRRLIFAGFGAHAPGLFWTSVDGTSAVEPLLTIENSSFIDARGWSRDGQSLLFTYGTPADPRIGLLSMTPDNRGKRIWKPLVERVGGALAGPLAPEGDWIVTESVDSGSWNIYIERFPRLGDRQRITTEAGGRNAVWSPDGRELFYRRASDEAMMAVSIQTRPALRIGSPHVLFERKDYSRAIDSRGWDVAPDGRFLMIKQSTLPIDSEGRPLILVQNWFEELKRVPTK